MTLLLLQEGNFSETPRWNFICFDTSTNQFSLHVLHEGLHECHCGIESKISVKFISCLRHQDGYSVTTDHEMLKTK
jgi:hypothetical protein